MSVVAVPLARAVHPVNVAAKLGETVTLQCSDFAANYVQVCDDDYGDDEITIII